MINNKNIKIMQQDKITKKVEQIEKIAKSEKEIAEHIR